MPSEPDDHDDPPGDVTGGGGPDGTGGGGPDGTGPGEASSTRRRALLVGGAGLLGAGAVAAGLAVLGRDGAPPATLPRPGATAPAGSPPGGWRDATRDHGARGTGEGDDLGALQDAIDAAAAEGAGRLRGGVVHVGPGVYPLGGSLHLRSGVTLWGSGPATVLQLRGGVEAPAIVAEADRDGRPVANVAVRSLTLDGSTAEQSPERHGIAFRHNNRGGLTAYTGSDAFPLVADVLVAYFGGHGLAIGVDPPGGRAEVRALRAWNVVVFECAKAAVDGDRAGIYVGGTDAVLVACEVAGCGGPGYDVVRANNRLESCKGYFNRDEFRVSGERNQLVGCQAQDGFGDGFVLRRSGGVVADLTLAGCQADSNAGAGFRLAGVATSSIVGCTSFRRGDRPAAGPAYVLDDVDRCLVSGTASGFDEVQVGDNRGGITQIVG